MLSDLRYAIRTLFKNRGFTCAALITLALAIGANTAIFSVVYGALLRPLPYADPDRLIVLNETHPRIGTISVSYPNFLDWRAQNHVFSGMALMASVRYVTNDAVAMQIHPHPSRSCQHVDGLMAAREQSWRVPETIASAR